MAARDDKMEEIWGPAAAYAEYRVNDSISYIIEGQTRTGTILWVCAPTTQAGQHLPMHYVVQPGSTEGSAEMVWPGNIVIDETRQQTEHPHSISAVSEPALIKLLATLSIPIIIQADTDDDGQRYYIWQVGASTPERPWGLYVGTHRQLLGAVKLALEKGIKHIQEHDLPR